MARRRLRTGAAAVTLAERGVPLFAVTHFGTAFWERFHPTAPVLGHFRDIVVSGEVRPYALVAGKAPQYQHWLTLV